MVDKGPDRADVILELFREGQCFAPEPAEALPQGVVESFDMRGATRFLAAWTVALGWQHEGVGRPEIGVRDGTLPIDGWQRLPELLGGGLVPRPNRDADNLTRVPIQRKPDPRRSAFALDKRPELIAFQGQSNFFFG